MPERPYAPAHAESGMKLSVTELDTKIVIVLDGAVELQSIKEFKDTLSEIGEKTQKDIEIDLSRVGYIDSTGISLLIMLNKQQKQKNKDLRIANASANVLGLLELSSLKEVLH